MVSEARTVDHIVFDSGLVRIGAFRCHPDHPSFEDSGPAQNYCFVFPRTAVKIEHEHEPVFVANPNVVTFYNLGQEYRRHAISPEGDYCDWFGVDPGLIADTLRGVDPAVESRGSRPFCVTRGWSDPATYLRQRTIFEKVVNGETVEPLEVEESIIELLQRVVSATYGAPDPGRQSSITSKQREAVRAIEEILSKTPDKHVSLQHVAQRVELSPYHVCRLFRRATGTNLHDYRVRVRLRMALAHVIESRRSLTDIALDSGFSSHSHFTDCFRREFQETPSAVRSTGFRPASNFLIARACRF